MNKLFFQFETKSFDDEKRIFEGVASTIALDRTGDVVDPKGIQFKLPFPILLHHDHTQPVGYATKAYVDGMKFIITAQLVKSTDDMPQHLKDRLDEAWASLKYGLIRGLSIGFRSIKGASANQAGGITYPEIELLETSLVVVPAHQDAGITTLKSFAHKYEREGNKSYSLPAINHGKQNANGSYKLK